MTNHDSLQNQETEDAETIPTLAHQDDQSLESETHHFDASDDDIGSDPWSSNCTHASTMNGTLRSSSNCSDTVSSGGFTNYDDVDSHYSGELQNSACPTKVPKKFHSIKMKKSLG